MLSVTYLICIGFHLRSPRVHVKLKKTTPCSPEPIILNDVELDVPLNAGQDQTITPERINEKLIRPERVKEKTIKPEKIKEKTIEPERPRKNDQSRNFNSTDFAEKRQLHQQAASPNKNERSQKLAISPSKKGTLNILARMSEKTFGFCNRC